MRNILSFSMLFVLLFQLPAVCKIVDRQDVICAADFIIMESGNYKHPGAEKNTYSLKDVQPLLHNSERVGYIVNMKPHGFMIMPDITELNPVKFISYTGNFAGIQEHPLITGLIEQLYYSKIMLNYTASKTVTVTAGTLCIAEPIDIDQIENNKTLWRQLSKSKSNCGYENKENICSYIAEKKDALTALDLIKNYRDGLKKTRANTKDSQDFDYDLNVLNEKLSGHFKNKYTQAVSFKDYDIPMGKWFATFKDQIDNKWPFLIGLKTPGYPGFDTVVVDGYLMKWGNKIHIDLRKGNYSDTYLDINNPCNIKSNTINTILNIYNPSDLKYITVQYPTYGSTFGIGNGMDIFWSFHGLSAFNFVNIKLMQNLLYAGEIVNKTGNNAEYWWEVETFTDGSPVLPGDNYLIRIKSYEDPSVIGYSDKFSITGETVGLEIWDPIEDSEWTIGQTYDIVWYSWGLPEGNVINIKLIQNGSYKGQIVNRAYNSGGIGTEDTYSWTISTYTDGTPIEPGTGYKVRLKCVPTDTVCYSGSFTIIE